MARIVVLDGHTVNPGDNPWHGLERLGTLCVYDRTPEAEVLARAAGAQVLITNKTPIRAAVLAALDGLIGVSVLATGVNVVDVAAARARNVIVCNVPSYGAESVAQHTIALLLELCHQVGLHDRAVHAGEWERSLDFSFSKTPLVELAGKRLGIVGYGAIGRRVAEVARALGMQICAARRPGAATLEDSSVERVDLDQLFARADVVSLHCPLTPESARLVNRARLERMQPSAFLLNTARGGLVGEHDLAHALDSGVIAGAALDVLSSEPPTADNPLLRARNCIITPHAAWTSLAARQRLLETTVLNVRALLAGKPIHVVSA